MCWSNDPNIHALRLKYNAAVTAHAECSRALTEATMSGVTPLAALVEADRQALDRMEDARAKLYEAMANTLEPVAEPRDRAGRGSG
jgi:hypothetical protein